MRNAHRIATPLVLLFASILTAQTVAFVDVTVIPMNRDGVLRGQTVITSGGKITELGPVNRVKVPDGATRVDGKGKFLMPGIAEMHGHLPPPTAGDAALRNTLELYVLNGVTTVRGMLGSPNHAEVRDRVLKGEMLGPWMKVAGPAFSGNAAKTPDDARRMVAEQKAAGFDHLKVQEGLSIETYEALAASAKQAKLDFAGHVPDLVGVERALAAGQRSIDHLDGYFEALESDSSPLKGADPQKRAKELIQHIDEKKLPGLVRATVKSGAYVVPTQFLWRVLYGIEPLDRLTAMPELRYMPTATLSAWQKSAAGRAAFYNDAASNQKFDALRDRILMALYRGGVPIVSGSDAPQVYSVPGFSMTRELVAMARAGMPAQAILRSATVMPARYFGMESEFGAVAKGHRADLILLEANPLDDVGNVGKRAGVMVRGRWIPAQEIETALKRIATPN